MSTASNRGHINFSQSLGTEGSEWGVASSSGLTIATWINLHDDDYDAGMWCICEDGEGGNSEWQLRLTGVEKLQYGFFTDRTSFSKDVGCQVKISAATPV